MDLLILIICCAPIYLLASNDVTSSNNVDYEGSDDNSAIKYDDYDILDGRSQDANVQIENKLEYQYEIVEFTGMEIHSIYPDEYRRVDEKMDLFLAESEKISKFREHEEYKFKHNKQVMKLKPKLVITNDIVATPKETMTKYVRRGSMEARNIEDLDTINSGYKQMSNSIRGAKIKNDSDNSIENTISRFQRQLRFKPLINKDTDIASALTELHVEKGTAMVMDGITKEYNKRIDFLTKRKNKIRELAINQIKYVSLYKNNGVLEGEDLDTYGQMYTDNIAKLNSELNDMAALYEDNSLGVEEKYVSYADHIQCIHACITIKRKLMGEFNNPMRRNTKVEYLSRSRKVKSSFMFNQNVQKDLRNRSIFKFRRQMNKSKKIQILFGSILGTAVSTLGNTKSIVQRK